MPAERDLVMAGARITHDRQDARPARLQHLDNSNHDAPAKRAR